MNKRLAIVKIRAYQVKSKNGDKNNAKYYLGYRVNLPKEFMESHGLKEGDLVCVLPLKPINNRLSEEKDGESGLRELLKEKLGLTEAETRVYLTLLKLGEARREEILKEIGIKGGGAFRSLLVKMTRKGLLSRERRYGKMGRSFYVYRPVIPSEMLEKGNEKEKVKEDPNTEGKAETQTNIIRGKIVKEVVARRYRQEKRGKVYEYGEIFAHLSKEYIGKRFFIVFPNN
jgi:predicted transcriptional regulator